MTPLVWSAEYEIGNQQFDDEHRALVALLNAVCDVTRNQSAPVRENAMGQFIFQMSQHFSREELLMRKMRYGDYLAHKSEHERLLLELQALCSRMACGEIELSRVLCNLLKDWLLVHINTTDRTLAAALGSNQHLQALPLDQSSMPGAAVK